MPETFPHDVFLSHSPEQATRKQPQEKILSLGACAPETAGTRLPPAGERAGF
jgi:hypothetical protein